MTGTELEQQTRGGTFPRVLSLGGGASRDATDGQQVFFFLSEFLGAQSGRLPGQEQADSLCLQHIPRRSLLLGAPSFPI